MAGGEVMHAVVVDVLGVLLVDGVVGQVHEQLLQVGLLGRLVFLGGEPGEALLVDVQAHGVGAAEQDVDAEVELEALD